MKLPGKWIKGVRSDTPLAEAAERVLDVRLRAVERALPLAVSDGMAEPEGVHKLRVATRRAGAALTVFEDCVEPKAARRARKRLKKVRRAAGTARDADVHEAMFRDVLEHASSEEQRSILKQIVERLGEERLTGRDSIRTVFEDGGVERLAKARRRVLRRIEVGSVPDDAHMPTMGEAARSALAEALGNVREQAQEELSDLDALHELRIRMKRLRYTMEIFEPCFDDSFKEEAYAQVESLQDHLGDVNDSSAIVERLERYLAEAGRGDWNLSDEDRARLEQLLERYRELLRQRHEKFLEWWQGAGAEALFESITGYIERPVAEISRDEAAAQTAGGDGGWFGGGVYSNEQAARVRSGSDLAAGHTPNGVSDPGEAKSCRVAAIDVGSNTVRLLVAEVSPEGGWRILDDEKETTRLASGVATTGRLNQSAVDRSVEVIGRLRSIAEGYGVDRLRVIATSAIREAEDGQDFVEAVRDRVGVTLEVITSEQEARLAFRSVESSFDLSAGPTAVVDIGGGSTEVVLSGSTVIEQIHPLPLGAVALTERFGGPKQAFCERFKSLRKYVNDELRDRMGRSPLVPTLMIGTGGTFSTLASIAMHREMGGRGKRESVRRVEGYEVQRPEVKSIIEMLRTLSPGERARVPGLPTDRADIIVAGLVVVDRLMKHLNVDRVQVHEGGVRAGLVLAMADELVGGARAGRVADPMAGVRRFAEACRYERPHSEQVARLAMQIFDQLAADPSWTGQPWTSESSRRLLEAAAVLHDVGYVIGYRRHHRHAYQLIVHSDLPGFTSRETEIIANIARYHRRACPKKSHEAYAKLGREERLLVRRLAAVLRVADGLDRTHRQAVRGVRVQVEDGAVCFVVHADAEPTTDLWGAERKSDLFESEFGLMPRLVWGGPEAESGGVRTRADAPAEQVVAEDSPDAVGGRLSS